MTNRLEFYRNNFLKYALHPHGAHNSVSQTFPSKKSIAGWPLTRPELFIIELPNLQNFAADIGNSVNGELTCWTHNHRFDPHLFHRIQIKTYCYTKKIAEVGDLPGATFCIRQTTQKRFLLTQDSKGGHFLLGNRKFYNQSRPVLRWVHPRPITSESSRTLSK